MIAEKLELCLLLWGVNPDPLSQAVHVNVN